MRQQVILLQLYCKMIFSFFCYHSIYIRTVSPLWNYLFYIWSLFGTVDVAVSKQTKQALTVSICAWFLKCQFGSLLQTRKKKSISNQTWFFFEFELDFYCLCSLQKSISKSNWFLNFLNLIFRNWKKIEWHSIFQKSSGDRQGVRLDLVAPFRVLKS